MITCDECGKFVEGAPIGTHWVCEDCKAERKEEWGKSGEGNP